MKDVNKEGEFGIKLIKANSSDPIFKDCGESFYMMVSHEDCFHNDEMTSIAETNHWKNHAFKIPNKLCYGLQFHPEISVKKYENEFLDLLALKKRNVINENNSCDENVSFKIANNFYNLIK
jgi:GMP synthase-like glutamine amidotransferase